MSNSPQLSRRSPFFPLIFIALLVTLAIKSPLHAQTNGQLSCSPCALNFGNVQVGGSVEMPLTLTNSGTSTITISSWVKGTPWFFYPRGLPLPYKLPGGQSVTFNMVYAPTHVRTSSGTFTFNSDASNSSLVVPISGAGVGGGGLTANPPSLGFGWVPVGSTKSLTIAVTNSSSSAITINQISSAGTPSVNPFVNGGITAPVSLGAGQSYTFEVTFSPAQTGDVFGNLVLVGSNGEQLSIAENGFGQPGGSLTVSPSTLNFGNVNVGSSQNQTITLTARANQVTISADSLGSNEYSISGLTLPATIPAGQSVPVTVTFSPQASGTASTNLAFSSNSSSIVASLTGNGVANTPQYSVGLAWQASTSQVVGYNVYRGGNAAGPFSKMNSSTDGSTSFSDTSVQAGSSYYYQVTSVDSSGTESAPTSPVAASIPN